MAAEVHAFQTKVSKLLKLLANSLYSNKEVFLRELVSNASDAIDKLRFESISHPELLQGDPAFAVRIRADKEAGTLTISDNGIGMTLEQANQHLGTIAQSGTEDFLEHLSADQAKDAQQIGQFGVGFYSAFIVADQSYRRVSCCRCGRKRSGEVGIRRFGHLHERTHNPC